MQNLLTKVILGCCLGSGLAVCSQNPALFLGKPFPESSPSGHFSFLGGDDRSIYILHAEMGTLKNLLVYDHQLQLQQRMPISFLQNQIPILILPRDSVTDFLYETVTDSSTYYTLIQETDNKVSQRLIAQLQAETAPRWILTTSKKNQYFLLYSLAGLTADSVKLNVVILNKEYEILDDRQFRFYVDRQFDRISDLYLDDEGNVYTIISDRPLNYRMGSRLRLFKYNPLEGRLLKKEYYFKEKKPAEIKLTFSSHSNQLYLHALFVDFYTKNIQGIVCGILDENLEMRVPFSYFEFDKSFKKQLNTYTSGIASAALMNFLKFNSVSVDSNGVSYASLTLETDRLMAPVATANNSRATKSSNLMEEDPIMGILQRETLIRRQMGYRGPVRGRRYGSTAEPTMDYSEAYATVMGQRPDLFFMTTDTAANKKSATGFIPKKIYDRQLLFAFDQSAKLKWYRWYETEDQNLLKRFSLLPTETESDFISLHYRHNSKEKSELAFIRIAKADGTYQEKILSLPSHITLLTTSPLLNVNANQAAIFYWNTTLQQAGLARLAW